MNKTFFLLATIALTFSACGGNSGTSSSDNINADTTATEQITTPEAFTTPDLAFYDVTGHVKSINYPNTETTVEFDADGKVLRHTYYDLTRLTRDNDGRMIKWGYDEYEIVWDGNRPASFTTRESDGTTITETFSYDDNGRVLKSVTEYDSPDINTKMNYTYTYNENDFDDHGNWISRSVTNSDANQTDTETRKIIYY